MADSKEYSRIAPEVRRAVDHVSGSAAAGEIPPGAMLTFNFHPDVELVGRPMLAAIADSGFYRSQFQTGTSNGGLTAFPGGARWQWESRLFGGAYDQADAGLRPKYGALACAGAQAGRSPRFGSCHFRLLPHALTRATFCYPDSYYDPDAFGTADHLGKVLAAVQIFAPEDPLDSYIEAHVHGPVSIAEDVEALVLDPSYKGSVVETLARSLPCAVEWHAGFLLTAQALPELDSYRGPETAALARELLLEGPINPAALGQIRLKHLEESALVKKVWHCMARFGWQGV